MDDRTTAEAFGLRFSMGAWSVVDLATEMPLIVRGRVLKGLQREEASDALSLVKILARLKSPPLAGLQVI